MRTKNVTQNDSDDLRPEYDLSQLKRGVRGKYFKRATRNKVVENMVLIARLPMEFRPVPIYVYKDKTLGHIPCEWLGVAQVDEENLEEPSAFILYFLDKAGVAKELLQYDTLQIAIDQARSIVGFPVEGFKRCSIPVAEDGSYNVDRLNDALSD